MNDDIVSKEIYIFLRFLFLLFLGRFSPWKSFFMEKERKCSKNVLQKI